MTFLEEVKSQIGDRAKAEDFVKEAIKGLIIKYTKMVGWPHNRAHFNGLDLQYLLLKNNSGWTDKDNIDDLKFYEVMQALNFVINFLREENFKVEFQVNQYGTDLIIIWENN